jgi:DNA-binding transcriptional regulator YiaG
MKRKYQSEILMVLHQDAQARHRIGAMSDEEMLQWDKDCLIHAPASWPPPHRAESRRVLEHL